MSTLCDDLRKFMMVHRWILGRMRSVSEKCNENQNTHFMFNNFDPENCAVCEIKWKNKLESTGHRGQCSMVHSRCMPDKWGYRYSPRTCNNYVFSTAIMVKWTRFNDGLYVHFLSCLLWRGTRPQIRGHYSSGWRGYILNFIFRWPRISV